MRWWVRRGVQVAMKFPSHSEGKGQRVTVITLFGDGSCTCNFVMQVDLRRERARDSDGQRVS